MTRWSVLLLLALSSCIFAQQPRKQRGAQCDLNSECDAPLVCRLSACRKECATTRDCGIGQQCVLDTNGLGACTLDSESHCAVASDCPSPLVCASTRCVNMCNDDRDCRDGAMCVEHGCVAPSTTSCVRDSECADVGGIHYVCTTEQRCGPECQTDRDCRYGTVCGPAQACVVFPDGGFPDSGITPDGGAPDAGPACTPGVPSTAVQLAAGYHFGCARLSDGRVACWGANDQGQLGHAGTGMASAAPVIVDGLTDARWVTTGTTHACAARATGAIVCWGGNFAGQLGDGTTTNRDSPVTVVGLTSTGHVAAGSGMTCATNATGDVVCWGSAMGGALGDGTTTGMSTSPAPSGIGLSGVSTVTAGSLVGCAIAGGPAVLCWGQNMNGITGTGTEYPTLVPLPTMAPLMSGGSVVVDVATRNSHTCALFSSGTMNCWGTNFFGELGVPVSANHPSPIVVPGVADAMAIGVGDRYTCLLGTAHDVRCFGWNAAGELGDGTTTDRDTPTLPVLGLTTADAIAVGNTHACALSGNEVYCWGTNTNGELGLAGPGAGPPLGAVSTRAIHIECLP